VYSVFCFFLFPSYPDTGYGLIFDVFLFGLKFGFYVMIILLMFYLILDFTNFVNKVRDEQIHRSIERFYYVKDIIVDLIKSNRVLSWFYSLLVDLFTNSKKIKYVIKKHLIIDKFIYVHGSILIIIVSVLLIYF